MTDKSQSALIDMSISTNIYTVPKLRWDTDPQPESSTLSSPDFVGTSQEHCDGPVHQTALHQNDLEMSIQLETLQVNSGSEVTSSQSITPDQPPPYSGFIGLDIEAPEFTNEMTNSNNTVTTTKPQVSQSRPIDIQPHTESDVSSESDGSPNVIRGRMTFLRKTFGLLSLHMLLIMGVIYLFTFHQEIHEEILWARWPGLVAIATCVAMIILGIVSVCETKISAMILQVPFVICLAFSVAYAAVQIGGNNFILLLVSTMFAIFTTSLLFTLQSRWDLSLAIVSFICVLPIPTAIIVRYSLVYAGLQTHPTQYLTVSTASSFICAIMLAIAHQMVHKKEGEFGYCGVRLYRPPDSWALSVIHLYLGLVLVIVALLIIVYCALKCRFCVFSEDEDRRSTRSRSDDV